MTEANCLPQPVRVLVAEDEPEIRDYLQLALTRPNFIIDFAEDGDQVLTALAENKPSVIILDISMPRRDGMSTLCDIRRQDKILPVIMLSGLPSASYRSEAMKNGANRFLTKPILHDDLRQVVDSVIPCVSVSSKPTETFALRPDLSLKGGSWIRKIDPLLRRVASSDVPMLLQGETGVGKEVLARRIHNQSLRADRIFLKLNCAALPSELVESELFGYERGAFTGALKSNPGKFELANGGTIFLDEIGDMDLRLQAKLLQVLQDQEFMRLGSKESTQVDVRVIAATHRDLEACIAEGEFREDLYYRLNVFNIVVPPLRERLDEIIPFAFFFLRKHAAAQVDIDIPDITSGLKGALLRYSWPGNVRELENVMRRYLLVGNPETLTEELDARLERTKKRAMRGEPKSESGPAGVGIASSMDVIEATTANEPTSAPTSCPDHLLGSPEAKHSQLAKLDQARREAETDVIKKTLVATQWNRKRAAASLGIDYKALLYKMKKLGID